MAGSGAPGPNVGLAYGWLEGEAGWGDDGFNPNFKMLDTILMPQVLSATTVTPPGSPVAGDRYLVPASGATGAWVGHGNALAVYLDSAWLFYGPKPGWTVTVADDAAKPVRAFRGAAWVALSDPFEDAPADGTSYARKDNAWEASTGLTDAPNDGFVYQRRSAAWEKSVEKIGLFIKGVPANATDLVAKYVFTEAVTLPSGLTASRLHAGVSASASTTFQLKKNGSNIGTLNIASGANVATFTFGSAVSFAAGDRLEAWTPGTLDATLADISITLVGTRG